jgi:hypothetical protein
MTKDLNFGRAADLMWTTRHNDPSITSAEIEDIVADVRRFADAGGINLRIERDGREVTYRFDNYADFLIVNEAYSPSANIEGEAVRHPATQFFENQTQGYQDTWIYHARDYLDKIGAKYRVEDIENGVEFRFETFEAYTTFRAFQDAGYFDRRTKARIGYVGPVEPGALPY